MKDEVKQEDQGWFATGRGLVRRVSKARFRNSLLQKKARHGTPWAQDQGQKREGDATCGSLADATKPEIKTQAG